MLTAITHIVYFDLLYVVKFNQIYKILSVLWVIVWIV